MFENNVRYCMTGLKSYISTDKNTSLDSIATPVILLSDSDNLRCYLPIIAIENRDKLIYRIDNSKRNSKMPSTYLTCIIPFPAEFDVPPRTMIRVNPNNIVLNPNIYSLDAMKVKEINQFDFQKIKSISKFVKIEKELTLVMRNQQAINNFIKWFYKFKDSYKLSIYRGHTLNMKANINRDPLYNGEIKQLILLIKIYDLPQIIPIFNKSYIDGIGIQVALIHPDAVEHNKGFKSIIEFNNIFTNHEQNVITVDGVYLENSGLVPSKVLHSFRDIIYNNSNLVKNIKQKGAPHYSTLILKKMVTNNKPATVAFSNKNPYKNNEKMHTTWLDEVYNNSVVKPDRKFKHKKSPINESSQTYMNYSYKKYTGATTTRLASYHDYSLIHDTDNNTFSSK